MTKHDLCFLPVEIATQLQDDGSAPQIVLPGLCSSTDPSIQVQIGSGSGEP